MPVAAIRAKPGRQQAEVGRRARREQVVVEASAPERERGLSFIPDGPDTERADLPEVEREAHAPARHVERDDEPRRGAQRA